MIDELMKKLLNAPIAFGLRAQGHLPIVNKMVDDGKTWQEIGQKIGWDPDTARRYYEREVMPSNLTDQRAGEPAGEKQVRL